MKLKWRIARNLYLAFAILLFALYCLKGFHRFGHFTQAENWQVIGRFALFAALGAVMPTVLVMLGVFSNTWFPRGFRRNKPDRLT